MVNVRAAKVRGIETMIPALERIGETSGTVLIIGWGSTYGAIRTVVEALQQEGKAITHVHCRSLNPLPKELGELVKNFEHVLVVELNLGQLCQIIRARYLVDAQSIHKVTGKPFSVHELKAAFAPYWEPSVCQAHLQKS